MQVAIQERSGDNNPDSNIKLKKIVSEAYSAGIPKASLQNTLKNFKDLEKVEVSNLIFYENNLLNWQGGFAVALIIKWP